MLGSREVFLAKIGDRKLTTNGDSAMALLTSSSEASNEEGIRQISELITSLVNKYKKVIFPLIQGGIETVSNNVEANVEKQLQMNIKINTLSISQEIIDGFNSVIYPIEDLPTLYGAGVLFGDGVVYKQKPVLESELNKLDGNEIRRTIKTMNMLMKKETNMTKIINGEYDDVDINSLLLVVNNLSSNEPPEGSFGKIGDYRDALSSLRNTVNYYVYKLISLIDKATASDSLIHKKGDGFITVYKDSLIKLYEQGGSIEIVYGLYLNNKSNMTVAYAITDATRYKKLYKYEYNKYIMKNKTISTDAYNFEYIMLTSRIAKDNNLPMTHVDNIKNKFSNYTELELADVKARVEEIIADNLFKSSGIRRFISAFEYFRKSNVSPEEAAGMAAMDLATDYIVSNINIQ